MSRVRLMVCVAMAVSALVITGCTEGNPAVRLVEAANLTNDGARELGESYTEIVPLEAANLLMRKAIPSSRIQPKSTRGMNATPVQLSTKFGTPWSFSGFSRKKLARYRKRNI